MARKSKTRKAGPAQARSASRELRPAPIPSNVEDMFGAGGTGRMLRPEFAREDVYAWFQKKHLKGGWVVVDKDGYYRRNGHEWKVPYGVRVALKTPLYHGQLVNKYPFYVTWISPTSNKRLKKFFMTLPRAVEFVAEKAQYADPRASIVSRHGYMIPAKLRNKIPRPFKWCPGCMTARKFYRVYPEQQFYAMVRDPIEHKMKERKLPVLACKVCGTTNRDDKFRRSNQIWVITRIKQGKRRTRRK